MRVIAGTAKGHRLKYPKGAPTRPATDLVKGAIFSILASMEVDWDRVLDLYSGSGQLGIEALSRGAGWADFVEREPRCCAIIKENLEKTRLADRAHIYCQNVNKAVSLLEKEYDIILMDPPYADKTIHETVTHLADSPLINRSSVIVVTHSPHLPLRETYATLNLVKENRHGDSCIAIYQKEAEV
jgi:16S rRNA (guanine966-N2)-methyltransferase